MGLEPTTFELEVQHASPLRHGGFRSKPYSALFIQLFKTTPLLFVLSLILDGCWFLRQKYHRNITISVQLSSPKNTEFCYCSLAQSSIWLSLYEHFEQLIFTRHFVVLLPDITKGSRTSLGATPRIEKDLHGTGTSGFGFVVHFLAFAINDPC